MELVKIFKSSCFQIRESPTPLNILTPTPAPDWGGPVACLGGPTSETQHFNIGNSTFQQLCYLRGGCYCTHVQEKAGCIVEIHEHALLEYVFRLASESHYVAELTI